MLSSRHDFKLKVCLFVCTHTHVTPACCLWEPNQQKTTFFPSLRCFLWSRSSPKGDSSIPTSATRRDCQLMPSPRALGDGETGFLLKTSPARCFPRSPSPTIPFLVPHTIARLFLSSARSEEKPRVGSMPSASSGAPSQTGSSKSPAQKPDAEEDKAQHRPHVRQRSSNTEQ